MYKFRVHYSCDVTFVFILWCHAIYVSSIAYIPVFDFFLSFGKSKRTKNEHEQKVSWALFCKAGILCLLVLVRKCVRTLVRILYGSSG